MHLGDAPIAGWRFAFAADGIVIELQHGDVLIYNPGAVHGTTEFEYVRAADGCLMFAFYWSATVAKGLCYEVVWTQNIVVFRDCLGSKLGNDGYTLLSALSVSKAIQFHNFVERLSTTKSGHS